MKNKFRIFATAAAATIAMIGTASACPPGYKSVKIQGNYVCRLDATSTNSLKAKPKPTLPQAKAQSQFKGN